MNRSLSFLAALALAVPAHAHYLWATLDPSSKTVAVALQEIPGDEPLSLAARAPKVKAWSKIVPAIPLKAEGSWLKAAATEGGIGASLDYGVLDKRDQGRGLFWLNYYAKAAATPEASQAKLGLPVELTVRRITDGQMVVTVWSEGKPAAGADVIVEGPVGTNTFEGKTDRDGSVALRQVSGLFAVRALVTKEGKGTHDGLAYDLVRSYSTLTVGAAPVAEEPFSRTLSKSFGANHAVVSHSAFIETVMDGKLTKAQLESHLQQRALVHDALHRILTTAQDVPYGDDQKNVLVLLFGDLIGMGSDWPTPAQAWPITNGFLQEVRDSAKQGPYFALGVMHVYYGGITNGGRDIGAMIADETKVAQNYYTKSDGYRDYLKKVDGITDPEARKEMIRGGQAAYKYIIAFNNEPAFRTK